MQSEPTLLRPSYQSTATGEERRYLLYLPSGYEQADRSWPVIFFLHGGGERGDGLGVLDRGLAHGTIYEAWIQNRDLPFIIVAPQLPVFGRTRQVTSREPPMRLDDGVPARLNPQASELLMVREAETESPDFAPTPGQEGFGPGDGWWKTDDLVRVGWLYSMANALEQAGQRPEGQQLAALTGSNPGRSDRPRPLFRPFG